MKRQPIVFKGAASTDAAGRSSAWRWLFVTRISIPAGRVVKSVLSWTTTASGVRFRKLAHYRSIRFFRLGVENTKSFGHLTRPLSAARAVAKGALPLGSGSAAEMGSTALPNSVWWKPMSTRAAPLPPGRWSQSCWHEASLYCQRHANLRVPQQFPPSFSEHTNSTRSARGPFATALPLSVWLIHLTGTAWTSN